MLRADGREDAQTVRRQDHLQEPAEQATSEGEGQWGADVQYHDQFLDTSRYKNRVRNSLLDTFVASSFYMS